MAKNLVALVAEKFEGEVMAHDTVKFTFSDADFCLTDGTLYQTVEGRLCGGFKKVRSLLAVENFVAERG